MATVLENKQTVSVEVSNAELNSLLIAPAKAAGFIDFDPTRVKVDRHDAGGFIILFEKVAT